MPARDRLSQILVLAGIGIYFFNDLYTCLDIEIDSDTHVDILIYILIYIYI